MHIFDDEDKQIFLIDDLDLKAKAIRNSILPRLNQIAEEIISKIIEIYKVDFYLDNSIVKSPNFRTRADRAKIKTDYNYCIVGISGIRKSNKWLLIQKKAGNIAVVLPLQLQLLLDNTGFQIVLHNQYLSDFYQDCFNHYFNFIIKYSELVQSLLFTAEMHPITWFDEKNNFIETYKTKLFYSQKHNWEELIFETSVIKYPVDLVDKEKIIDSALAIYPLYQALINISKGEDDMFIDYIKKLNKYKWCNRKTIKLDRNKQVTDKSNFKKNFVERIEKKIKIMPSIRWQVFQRDQWKCVSCGRNVDDGIILHVDHIIPRSKGGADILTNYQTLCNICNFGKSNKDNTDLRSK